MNQTTHSNSQTFNFPFNYVNENQNLSGSGTSSNSYSVVGATALQNQQNALHMPNTVQMGGPSMQQMAHHHLDHFPSYQNSLFNQEEAQV